MYIVDSDKYINNKKEDIVVFSLQHLSRECALCMNIAYFVKWDLARKKILSEKINYVWLAIKLHIDMHVRPHVACSLLESSFNQNWSLFIICH
jgi:hypothetical protein